jgi:hypothetical protein
MASGSQDNEAKLLCCIFSRTNESVIPGNSITNTVAWPQRSHGKRSKRTKISRNGQRSPVMVLSRSDKLQIRYYRITCKCKKDMPEVALREIGCCQIRETNNRCQCGLCDGKPFESVAPEVPESYIRYPLAVLECACILTTSSENNAVAASNSKTNQPVMATSIRMIVFVHWMAWVMRGRAPKSRLLKLGFSIDEVGWPRRFSMLLKRCLTAKYDCCAMEADLASYGIFPSIPRAYPP